MIFPIAHPLTDFFWGNYIRLIIRQDFREIQTYGNIQTSDNQSILLLANHFSWWDGFFAYDLNRRIFCKRFHVMMLEKQLIKNAFLRSAGAFSVRKNSRQVLESLSYCQKVLSEPKNLLLLFPQGEIQLSHTQKVHFQKGVFRLLENLEAPVQIIFLVNVVEYGSHRKPTLHTHLQTFSGDTTQIASAYQQFYSRVQSFQTLF
jgi:1-acyl-sn-glycerol-3-phosphate acyltransferase